MVNINSAAAKQAAEIKASIEAFWQLMGQPMPAPGSVAAAAVKVDRGQDDRSEERAPLGRAAGSSWGR